MISPMLHWYHHPWKKRTTSNNFASSHSVHFNYAWTTIPIGSMYGMYANIGGILMVNVSIQYIYTIHGPYGIIRKLPTCLFLLCPNNSSLCLFFAWRRLPNTRQAKANRWLPELQDCSLRNCRIWDWMEISFNPKTVKNGYKLWYKCIINMIPIESIWSTNGWTLGDDPRASAIGLAKLQGKP